MNLPNYFLADLPKEATLSAQMVADACETLKHNRAQYLAARSTASMTGLLAEVAEAWLNGVYPFRRFVLEQGPRETGFPRGTLETGLDNFFKQIARENIEALLEQELGHTRRLDELTLSVAGNGRGNAAIVTGPELLVHIAAGNIPNPTLMSIVLGLLTRSAQFVKCASGAAFLPRIFVHSLYDVDRKLGACLEIAEWRGGDSSLEEVLFSKADCVTATGSDETLAAIRRKLPAKARMIGHGYRLSFGFVASDALTQLNALKVVQRVATDVVAWNQLGCLSPHVIYVEHGGGVAAEQFAEMLAVELATREQAEPRGEIAPEDAATIASRRAFYEVRAAHSPETKMWRSENSTAWTVVYDGEVKFQTSCLNWFVYVKGVAGVEEMLRGADDVRGKISTIGIAATEGRAEELALQLARWGVTRVCPLGRMQNPPLTWRHDGRPALADLLTWMDYES